MSNEELLQSSDAPTPTWMIELESRLNTIKETRRLEHEIGAGAPCLKCGAACPGLELHFWRKRCIVCKCKKEAHDVPPEDDSNLRFEILFNNGKSKASKAHRVLDIKVKEFEQRNVPQQFMKNEPVVTTKEVSFDWVPPDTPNDLAAEYMDQLPKSRLPISGTEGAKYRKAQLDTQIPLYDVTPDMSHKMTPVEKIGFQQYLKKLVDNVAGQGKIQRICQTPCIINSVPCMSLPGAKYSVMLGNKDRKPDQQRSLDANLNSFVNLNIKEDTNTVADRLSPVSGVLHQGYGRLPSDFRNNNERGTYQGLCDLLEPHKKDSEVSKNKSPKLPIYNADLDQSNRLLSGNGSLGMIDHPANTLDYSKDDQEKYFDPAKQPSEEVGSHMLVVDKPLRCPQCQLMIQFGTVAVFAERAGTNVAWHPQCFVCDICQELLVDLIYFFRKDKVYCLRHYAEKANIPRCHACDELIFVPSYTLAEENTYHIDHFCCFECDVELADKEYLWVDDHPICLPCYEARHSQKCSTCKGVIKAHERGACLFGHNWHATPECFKCAHCTKSLLDTKIFFNNHNIFCSKQCLSAFGVVQVTNL